MLSTKRDYGFLIGLIRVLETRLLHMSHIERMLDAKDAEEAFAVLNDTDFKDSLPEAHSVKDFDMVLEHSILETKNMLEHHAPSQDLCRGLWLWYDFYNIKIALKSFLRGDQFEEDQRMLSPFGSLDFTLIRDFAFQGKGLDHLQGIRKMLLDQYETTKDIRIVDFIFDKELFKQLLVWAKKLGSDVLVDWLKKQIDLSNIQTFLRLSQDQKEIFESVFIEGGEMEKSFFQGKREDVIEKLLKRPVAEGVKVVLDDQQYQTFLRQADDILTKIIKAGRYAAHGPEAIIGYWWARQKTAEIIRVILAGKTNHIDDDVIRASVKTLY